MVQLAYWLFAFRRLAFYREETPSASLSPSVSVVICARNEAENLAQNLPKILNQDYNNCEFIVVNDASTDDTAAILEQYASENPKLRVIHLEEKKILGKKGALSAGITAARHDWILLTDADCYPLSSDTPSAWVSGMVSAIGSNTEIVLGYAPYRERDSRFLNKFIRFEAIWTAVQYMGFALAGMPYMGVGRNLMYRKSLFEREGGFGKHLDLMSGDDDLFVNQVITKKNFSLFLQKQAIMVSEPKTRWIDYFTQKKRHLTTGTRYKTTHKLLLGGLALSHYLFFVTAILALSLKISTIFVLFGIVTRTSVMWILYGRILRRFHEKRLIQWIPILDLAYVLFYVVFTPYLFFSTRKWK